MFNHRTTNQLIQCMIGKYTSHTSFSHRPSKGVCYESLHLPNYITMIPVSSDIETYREEFYVTRECTVSTKVITIINVTLPQ